MARPTTKQNDHERHRRRRRHGPNVDSTVAVAAASSGRPASSAVTYRTLLLLQRTPIRPQSALYTSISVFFPSSPSVPFDSGAESMRRAHGPIEHVRGSEFLTQIQEKMDDPLRMSSSESKFECSVHFFPTIQGSCSRVAKFDIDMNFPADL